MGATNSGIFFQKVMEEVLVDLVGEQLIIFQDDILIATKTQQQHMCLLSQVLSTFQRRGITIKASKCSLMKHEITFLGHLISKGRISPDPNNVKGILELTPPRNKRMVRSFVGKINFYARFVEGLTDRVEPIQKLIRGNGKTIEWDEKANKAFADLKLVMASKPVLMCPDYGQPFHLSVSHSDVSVAASLEQEEHGGLWPVGYFSRRLKAHELNYSTLEKEALAIVDSFEHFHHIIHGYNVIISSNQGSLEYLRGLREGNSRINKWIVRMMKHSPELVKRGSNSNVLSDLLISNDITSGTEEESSSVKVDDCIKIEDPIPTYYTDGSCTHNGKADARAGAGIYSDQEPSIRLSFSIDGKQTNNRAEIIAVIEAIRVARERGHSQMRIITDSKYVLENINKNIKGWKANGWLTNRGKGIVNIEEFKQLDELLEGIKVVWEFAKGHSGVRGNELADQLAVQGSCLNKRVEFKGTIDLDGKINDAVMVQDEFKGTIDLDSKIDDAVIVRNEFKGTIDLAKNEVAKEAKTIPDKPKEVMDLENNVLTDSREVLSSFAIRTLGHAYSSVITKEQLRDAQNDDPEMVKIIKEMSRATVCNWDEKGVVLYVNVDNIVCARGTVRLSKNISISVDGLYVPKSLRYRLLKNIHESNWCIHPTYYQLCREVLKYYFWATFRSDVRKFVMECRKCILAKESRKKAPILDFDKPARPLEMVAADIVGPVTKSFKGNEYILSILDIFSRHITLIPIGDQKTETILRAFESHYIAKYGSPEILLTDNGSNFASELFQKVCNIINILHRFVPPWHPQGNGAIERSNRELKKRLTHLCHGASQNWDDKIHFVEFSINNTCNGSTGHAPNELLYGRMLRSPDTPDYANDGRGGDVVQQPYLDMLKDRLVLVRSEAKENDIISQKSRNKRLNKNRKLPVFTVGQRVYYKKVSRGSNRHQGFVYRYTGPYDILSKISDVTYRIRDPEKPLEKSVVSHVDRLKDAQMPTEGLMEPSTGLNNEVDTGQVVLSSNCDGMGNGQYDSTGECRVEKRGDVDAASEIESQTVSDDGACSHYATRSKGYIKGIQYDKMKFDKAGRITISE